MAEYKSNYTGEQIDAAIEKANSALQEEFEPAFNASASKDITNQDITNWNAKAELSDIPDVSDFITKDVNDLTNYTTTNDMNTAINNAVETETTNRQNSDVNLQSQIDAITSASDVVDVVGTYEDLQNYTTTSLTTDDVIKVLQDSTHNNALSYYRWTITNDVGEWVYVGSEGPFYTKSEADTLLNNKYTKPDTGIPKTDLSQGVQDSLNLADSGLILGEHIQTNDYGVFDFSEHKPGIYLIGNEGVEHKLKIRKNPSSNSFYVQGMSDAYCYIMFYYKDVNTLPDNPSENTHIASILIRDTFNNSQRMQWVGYVIDTSGKLVKDGSHGQYTEMSFLFNSQMSQQYFRGLKTFEKIPQQSNTTAPTLDTEFTNKKYVDDLVSGLANNVELTMYNENAAHNFDFSGKYGIYVPTSQQNTFGYFAYKNIIGGTSTSIFNGSIIFINVFLNVEKAKEEASVYDKAFAWALVSKDGRLYSINFRVTSTGNINIAPVSYMPSETYFLTTSSQTINGIKTFNSIPKVSSYVAPTTDTELVAKKYVDDSIANAITTTLGGSY